MTSALPGGSAIIDANILMSFAVVDRLDLLEVRYGNRVVWTDGIRIEVARGIRAEPRLQRVVDMAWITDPIEIDGGHAAQRVEQIRRALGGLHTEPLRHLGEAQGMYLLETSHKGGKFLTDDRAAASFARRQGLIVYDTADILSECHAMGEIGCPDAYKLLQEMADEGRGVRIPGSHLDVC